MTRFCIRRRSPALSPPASSSATARPLRSSVSCRGGASVASRVPYRVTSPDGARALHTSRETPGPALGPGHTASQGLARRCVTHSRRAFRHYCRYCEVYHTKPSKVPSPPPAPLTSSLAAPPRCGLMTTFSSAAKSKREGPRSGFSRVGYAHHVSIPAPWICHERLECHAINPQEDSRTLGSAVSLNSCWGWGGGGA
jgi:hypothetical protein